MQIYLSIVGPVLRPYISKRSNQAAVPPATLVTMYPLSSKKVQA
ncbi:hypothetical protein HMPREF1557_00219 [Streptococcus sobrinus W1703]|uniref:Uncharacterized protein n=1 Tax=Streptococcus sobrinus W1703 TaxID=1227275 RepID=U2JFK5_9STRE|nr:hypothetical protein HMPREF1557_00219 [Streptococcus sobrinus W1703]